MVRWSPLLEVEDEPKVAMSSAEQAAWVEKLRKEFHKDAERSPKLSPKSLITVLGDANRSDLKGYKDADIVKVSKELEGVLLGDGIDVYWEVPPSYQLKAVEFLKQFKKHRALDKEKKRVSDGDLFVMLFAKVFGIKPSERHLYGAVASDKSLAKVLMKTTKALKKMGHGITDEKPNK